MYFQKALLFAMQEKKVGELELTKISGANPRWITEITTNSDWHPRLDTILRLCYSLEFDVFSFLDYAEFGFSRNNVYSSKYFPGNRSTSELWDLIPIQKKVILEIMPIHVAKAFRSLRKDRRLSQKN
ncbi:hypothetical protein [Sphaerochaeta sp. S2]|uniref:hypothetical protein n=1 Tax=Sphaerochaeta sp. S2 TaxID=2798868 RepID=UPI0018EA1D23|nr:hypothetical protein [Sphaerochaeta sp. S2]MBJ2357941.1 hypothetical protein [Sphaerochaeta sp. S2]